jgi:hypothetical protein
MNRKIVGTDMVAKRQGHKFKSTLQAQFIPRARPFNQHINHVCNKLAQSNYIINRVKNVLPKNVLRTLYLSLFHSHLLYCLPLYACTSTKNLNRLKLSYKIYM